MRFAHIADIHIAGWRDPVLRELSVKAFESAIERCIALKVDFVLISGDLFNTSLPPIDALKTVVERLRSLKDEGIAVYTVAGSHDYSATGKTMLDVLESADLCRSVFRGTVVENRLRLSFSQDKSGAKITGMIGRKGMLERAYYEDLDRSSLEAEPGFRIFMFHTALTELKPEGLEKMESSPVSLLPKGFDYYAGGHVHERIHKELPGYGPIVYPGPLFPNSFSELERLTGCGFTLFVDGKIEHVPIQVCNIYPISISCQSPEMCMQALNDEIATHDFFDTVVTIRLQGTMRQGTVSDIDFRNLVAGFHRKGAIAVLRNTVGLCSREFEEIKIEERSSEETESALIEEHIGKAGLERDLERTMAVESMRILDKEKGEGERAGDFESRVITEMDLRVSLRDTARGS
jgi:DNA repair protein SbcD/Mre11